MGRESTDSALSGAAQGAAIGSVVPGIGTAIGAGVGGLLGYFSGSGAEGARQEREDRINQTYDEAGRITDQGFSDTRNQITDTSGKVRGIGETGFARTGDIYDEGYGEANKRLSEGQTAARGAYDNPTQTAIRNENYNRILGKGGYGQELIDKLKAQIGDTYASAGRDIVQQAGGGFVGSSQAPGVRGEALATGFGKLAQNRVAGERQVDLEDAQLREQQQTGAMEFEQRHADTISRMEERFGEAGSRLSVEEAVSKGQLSQDEMQFFADLEMTTGESLAGLTLAQAIQKAQMLMNKSAAINSNSYQGGNAIAALAPITGALISRGVGGGFGSPAGGAGGGGGAAPIGGRYGSNPLPANLTSRY